MMMKINYLGWFYFLISFMEIAWACFAEDITTGNLLPNGTNNASNYQNVDTSCLLYTSPSPRDGLLSRMPSSA